MDSITIGRLRESVSLLPMGELDPVHEFYRRLFELAPDARPLFTREIGLQAREIFRHARVGHRTSGES